MKSFWGTNEIVEPENAARLQINTAIITYFLLSVIAKDLKIKHSHCEMLQIFYASLLNKTSVNELLTKIDHNNIYKPDCNQLILNLF